MKQSKEAVCHWWEQRVTAILLLFLSPCFAYLLFAKFNSDLQSIITHPLELMFFIVLLFYAFWHAILGMEVICEDYIHDLYRRRIIVTTIKHLSGITYATLVFTIFFFYRKIFLL